MSPTVDALRNEIRVSVGRYERVESTAFTKEALTATADAVGADRDATARPSKSEMRAAIRRSVGELDDDPALADRPFRKAELETVATVLREE